MFIRQILNAKAYKGVVTAEPSTPLKNLSDVLSKYNFGCLVISGDGFTADGILSERDIVRVFTTWKRCARIARRRRDDATPFCMFLG